LSGSTHAKFDASSVLPVSGVVAPASATSATNAQSWRSSGVRSMISQGFVAAFASPQFEQALHRQ
jgi:hypothetical protein